jgi:maltose alpha-D-glucosyltransferase / alpha-amylase
VKCKHYLNFVRHHDELNINQLDKNEQKDVLEKFAPDDNMRVYSQGGIKRQLAPMMQNDVKKIKLIYVSIFSLPGSPLIHFGEEIGMGEDLNRKLRESVRIPMQWSGDLHGGFSKAPIERLNHKTLPNGEYSYHNVNVKKQSKDSSSLLSFMKSLIIKRKNCPEIGRGEWDTLSLDNEKLLAILYTQEEKKLLVICNFSSKKEKGKLGKLATNDELIDILSDDDYKKPSSTIEVNAYGYRWIKIVTQKKVI